LWLKKLNRYRAIAAQRSRLSTNCVTLLTLKSPLKNATLKPQTKLCELFPRDNRIEVVADMEAEMGLHVNLLQPKRWIVYGFAGLLLAAIALSFFNNIAGLL
jgi:hypothetical protein